MRSPNRRNNFSLDNSVILPEPDSLQPGLQGLHNYALPKCYNFALALRMPSMPTSHPHPQSAFPILPFLSLCVAASSARNIFPPLQVNCDSTRNNNSNVNSEINSFLGISSPYPRAELSSCLLCTPVFAYTWHDTLLDDKQYEASPVPFAFTPSYLRVHLLFCFCALTMQGLEHSILQLNILNTLFKSHTIHMCKCLQTTSLLS